MANGLMNKLLCLVFLTIVLVFFGPTDASSQLITYIDSVETQPENDSIVINMKVDNFSGEKITGFTLWVSLQYADFIGFFADSGWLVDTIYENCLEDSCLYYDNIGDSCFLSTCLSWADTTIDSSWVEKGAIDTASAITGGWHFMDVSILDSENKNLKVNAIANDPNSGGSENGIPSPTSQGLLCRIRAEVKDYTIYDSCEVEDGDSTIMLPWVECFCDSIIRVTFDTAQTRFSNDSGQFIGWVWSDTAYACATVPPDLHKECVRKCASDEYNNYCLDSVCYYEYDGSCYLWECTNCLLWDSSGYVDPSQVLFSHGQIEVTCPEYLCGDANSDGAANVSDAVWVINYVFIGGQPPNPLARGEVNCDGSVNVSDAVWIINYVFIGGNMPCDPTGDGIPDC